MGKLGGPNSELLVKHGAIKENLDRLIKKYGV